MPSAAEVLSRECASALEHFHKGDAYLRERGAPLEWLEKHVAGPPPSIGANLLEVLRARPRQFLLVEEAGGWRVRLVASEDEDDADAVVTRFLDFVGVPTGKARAAAKRALSAELGPPPLICEALRAVPPCELRSIKAVEQKRFEHLLALAKEHARRASAAEAETEAEAEAEVKVDAGSAGGRHHRAADNLLADHVELALAKLNAGRRASPATPPPRRAATRVASRGP